MTSYEFVGKDISKLWEVVGVRTTERGVRVQAHSWRAGIATVELTAEQAKELIQIIATHLPKVAMTNREEFFETVGEAYREVGVGHGYRHGRIMILVSEGDIYATVDLTIEQANELSKIIKAHLPSPE
ncbi:hypothetical protein [Paenarthrobacter sp. NPDC089316]|uniref:hypothetical protein n=1 Tax=unclassified Paenarthrobacter TaxID=2634190 RepID=UPI00342CAD65